MIKFARTELEYKGRQRTLPVVFRVGLDAAAVLAVHNLRVLESHSINGVVALPANRSDTHSDPDHQSSRDCRRQSGCRQ